MIAIGPNLSSSFLRHISRREAVSENTLPILSKALSSTYTAYSHADWNGKAAVISTSHSRPNTES